MIGICGGDNCIPARWARKAARMPSSILECAAMSMAMRVVSMPSAFSRSGKVLEARVRARDHGQFRRVDRGDVEVAEVGFQRGLGEGNGEHPARGHGVEKLSAQADEADGGFQRHDPRDAGGGVFAHRVPDQHGRADAPAFPELRQRDLDDQDQRQLLGGLAQGFRRGGFLAGGGKPKGAGLGLGLAQGGKAPVHPFGEDGLGLVEVSRHVGVLRAAAGEHEDDVGAVAQPALGEDAAGIAGLQHLRGFLVRAGDKDAAVFEGAAAFLERPGDVGEVLLRVGAQVGGKPRRGLTQGRLAAGGKGDELEGPVRSFGGRKGGGLLHDDMCVGSADTQGVHPGAAGAHAAGPVGEAVVDAERAAVEVDGRVRGLEIEAGWHLLVVQREGGLDQACDPGGGVEVADVGLYTADPGEAFGVGRAPERFGQRGDLDGIAEIGAGAVAFDVIDGFRRGSGDGEGGGDAGGLPLDRGGQVARFGSTVVVDRGTLDDGPDVVAIGQGILQPPQEDRAGARAEDRPLGPVVEGMADAVGREDFALLVDVAASLGQVDGHATGQGHVAFAVQKRLDRVVDGDQRGRAGRLQPEARTLQVEDVADAGREEVLVVAGMAQKEHAGAVNERRVRAEVEIEIAAHPASGEDTDAALEPFRSVTGVLQRLPRHFKELAVLWVEDRGFLGREAEEFGVEAVKALEQGGGGHVVRIAQKGRAFARRQDLFFGQPTHGRTTLAQVLPIAVDVGRPRQVGRHADNGDIGLCGKVLQSVLHATTLSTGL
jgi:hypothetical protein